MPNWKKVLVSGSNAHLNQVTASSGIHLADNAFLNLGDGNDLQLYHDGNHSYIKDNGTGNLHYRGGTQTFQNGAGSKTMVTLNSANSVDLNYNNSTKFQTTNIGVSVTGNIVASTHITASGNISGSATSTGSFVKLQVGSATIQIPSNGFITMGSEEGMVKNTRFGNNAGQNLEAGGTQNVIIGEDAGSALTTGDKNVAMGVEALKTATGDSQNVAIGYRALKSLNTTNATNVAVGTQAGDGLTTGTANVLLGHSADTSANNGTNQIVIGSGVTGTGDNHTVIGNSSQTSVLFGGDAHVTASGNISGSSTSHLTMGQISSSGDIVADGDVVAYNSSDMRLKNNLQVIEGALDKIDGINGYEFDWNDKSPGWAQKRGHDVGVVAQEIEKIHPEIVEERKNGYLGVDYKRLVPLLIQSVKELKQEVEELKKKV